MSNILIVDDKEENRYLLHTILTAAGHATREATNGAQALEAARREPPDLIISDILMPQMDGFALCRECKRDEALYEVPFVFYTATYTDPRDRDLGLQLGAARFLVKPMEAGEFSAIIAEVLKEHAQGKSSAPPPPAEDETTIYRLYNEALVRKLEDKMLALEETNRALQSEMIERERLTDERARQMQVLEASLNEIYMFAADSLRFTYVNLGARKNLGYTMDELFQLTPVDLKPEFTLEQFQDMLRPLLSHQEEVHVFETRHRRKDGTLYPVEVHLQLVGALFVSIIHDISERKRAEEEIRLLQTIAISIGEAESLDAAYAFVLQKICDAAGWDMGEVWIPSRDSQQMNCHPVWYSRVSGLEEFRQASQSHVFAPGEGLPGSVWQTQQPLWIPDVSAADNFPRKFAAASAGVHEAVGVPVRARGQVVLVMDFFLREPRAEDQRMMQLVSVIATQIGALIERRQAEAQVEANERRFRAMTEKMSDTIALLDGRGILLYRSESGEGLLGYAEEEVLGRSTLELIHPDDLPRVAELFAQLAASPRQSRTAEFRYKHKNGNWLYVETSATNLLNDPDVGAIVVNYRDISERKHAEEALRQSEERFRLISSTTSDYMFSTGLDADGQLRLNWVAGAFARITGYTMEEFVARGGWRSTLHPDDLALDDRDMALLRANQRIVSELRTLTKAGELCWVRVYAQPVLDPHSGELASIYGAVQDITARKRAEEESRLLQAIALGIGEAADLNAALGFVLRQICDATGWVMGEAWAPAPDDSKLISLPVWHNRVPGLETFRQASQNHQFAPGEGLPGSVWLRKKALWVEDVSTATNFPRQQAAMRAGVKSAVGIPVLAGEECLLVMNFFLFEPRPQDQRMLEVISAVAAQVGVQIARKQAEESLHRRLVELEAVAKIAAALRTAETVEELLTSLLDETLALFGTDSGSIRLYHPGAGVLYNALARGWFEPLRAAAIRPGAGIVGAVFISGQAHISREFTSDPLALPESKTKIPPGWGGICVPLPAAAEVVGAMFIGVPLPREITAAEARLLTSLAEIAGSALHRLRLHEETVRSLQQLITLRTIDQAISSSLDLKETLEVLVSQAAARLHVDAAAVLLLPPQTRLLEFAAGYGFRSPAISHSRLRLGEGEAGRAAAERRTLQFPAWGEGGTPSARAALLADEQFVTHHVTPLIAKGEVRGVLEVFHRTRFEPDPDWLRFFEALATQAAIALENVTLYQALQEHAAELERRVAERTAALEAASAQLRQALAQERELNELKTRFISMVSHEFRTPLTAILSSAELLDRYSDRLTTERRQIHLQRIAATVQHMTALLEDVLLIGRDEAGRLQPTPQPVDILAFCQDLIEELQLGVGARHQLQLDLSGLGERKSLPALIDEQLLRQILGNLLSNAIKYSSPASLVRLVVQRRANQMIFQVIDQGIGIPATDLPHLFEPFHRAANVGSAPGTGLGLNIVRRAATRCGGEVTVQSAEGQGTTFTVTLPLYPPAPPRQGNAAPQRRAP